MPVSDFECQIVRGQIGRYLDGGVLSPVALAGLEEHLAECSDCKATVTERRAALLGTLGKPTHAVVSMPVENPLVAALRARAEAEKAEPVEPESVATPKAAPRYAKPASVKGNLTKPLALAGLLVVVLLGMGRLSHTATAPTAKASAAFASESLPEAPKATPTRKTPVKPTVIPALAKPVPPKTVAPKPPKGSLDDLFVSKAKANPDARESVPATKKPVTPLAKPVVRKARVLSVKSGTKPAHRARVHRVKLRRSKTASSASKSTVRVYGLDGRPLKP